MCNGKFMQKDPDDALEFLDEIAENAHQWTALNLVETTNRSRIATSSTNKGIYKLKEEDDWKLKFEVLTKEIAALKIEKSNLPQPVYQVCDSCYEIGHTVKNCPIFQEMKGAYVVLLLETSNNSILLFPTLIIQQQGIIQTFVGAMSHNLR
ncbi:unnamed protein product [Prunus brigantina]